MGTFDTFKISSLMFQCSERMKFRTTNGMRESIQSSFSMQTSVGCKVCMVDRMHGAEGAQCKG